MNRELIQKTEEFLKAKLKESAYFKERPASEEYRVQHSYRVANIGKEIENCLLYFFLRKAGEPVKKQHRNHLKQKKRHKTVQK